MDDFAVIFCTELIKVNEKIVAIEPANFKALTALGNYLFLLGFAYTPDIAEKSKLYTRAVEYFELAISLGCILPGRGEEDASKNERLFLSHVADPDTRGRFLDFKSPVFSEIPYQ